LNEVEVARVDDCPTSTVVGLTEIVGDERAAFTVRVTPLDVTVTGDTELSLIWSLKDHVPTMVRVPVEVNNGELHDEELPKLV
jgi:hypothetical protein